MSPIENAVAMAAILSVARPGISDGSRIELKDRAVLTELDEGVRAPGFSLAEGRVVWDTWTRRETYDEGMARYAIIARAVTRVANNPPAEWVWLGRLGALQIVRAEVTIARHESGFWRSVHEGKLRGPAGEACLVQIHPATARHFGIDLESLVGLDEDSTYRCIYAGVFVLAKARVLAERRCHDGKHWFEPTIAAYGSGKGCVPTGDWVNGVQARVNTYAKTGMKNTLPSDVLALLVDKEE